VKEIPHVYECDLDDAPDTKACPNVVRLKAKEEYILGFTSKEEKEKWVEHYYMLRFKSKPRKEISSDSLEYPQAAKKETSKSITLSSSSAVKSPQNSAIISNDRTSAKVDDKNKKKGEEKEPLIQKQTNGKESKDDIKKKRSRAEEEKGGR